MPNPLLDAVLRIGGSVLDRVIPDPEAREAARIELARQAAQHEIETERLFIERARVYLSDRADARLMQRETRDITPRILAFCAFFGFFAALILLAFFEVPEGSGQLFNVLVVTLQGILFSIVGYYFGSSEGSSRKQETLDEMLRGQGARPAAPTTETTPDP
jgi:hypothetical protein